MDDIRHVDIVNIDLENGNIHRSFLKHSIGNGDSSANRFGIRVFRAGVAVALVGAVCQGFFRNANGENIALTSHGTVSGNVAYVTLPQACYNYEGCFSLAIKLVGGGVTGTMRIVDGMVDNTNTGGAVAPTGTVPTYQEVLAVYEEMVESVETVENIETAINGHYEKKQDAISPNMYDKTDEGIKPGYYGSPNGWTSAGGDERLGTTHPIYLIEGNAYKWPADAKSLYGTNAKYAWKLRYPGDGEIIDMTNEGEEDNGYYTVTINASGWYVFNIDVTKKSSFMLCAEDQYPDYYIGYNVAKIADDYPNVFLTFEGEETEQYLSIIKKSANMFDKSSQLIQTTRYCSGWDWSQNTGDNRLGATHPIYLQSGKTYKWIAAKSIYGANNGSYLWRVTSLDDLTIISRKQGEFSENDEYVTWTCDETGYWVVDINIQAKDAFMFCLSSEYPNSYERYGAYYAKNNIDYSEISTVSYLPLYGKTLVCDGDSIAAATPDSPEGKGGWFGRLRDSQKITGENYAVGGGSITYLSDSRHCISRSIDDIYDDYEELDYLILEGGTNDADLIGQFDGDTPPEGFGTWSETDFSGEYDDTTFCGAVESMFYKAVTYWPNAHIGYIVAMEMGHNNNASTNNRKRYFDEAVKIAKKWHISVLNLWENSGADARLTAFYDPTKTNQQNIDAGKFYIDGQHPTSYGYNKMQPMIEEWVKGL